MRNAKKEELFVGLFMSIVLGVSLALMFAGREYAEDSAQSRTIEKYNKVYSLLDDEQKRRADSLSPVCTEDQYRPHSCEVRTEFLEKLYLSGGDIPQSDLPVSGE